MDDAHLTPEGLRKLLEESGDEEMNRLLLHLLAVCPSCHRVGGYLLDLYRTGAIGLPFSTIDVGFARSRAEAPALMARLARYPFERQRAFVRDLPRFRSWGLCELLCEESERVAPADARRAVELAELAVELAGALEEWQPAEELWLFELRANAWAHLGNARRVLGEMRSAREAFTKADELWRAGADSMGDVLGYEARILAMKASFLAADRRPAEARAALDQALQAEPAGSLRLALVIGKAKLLGEEGESDFAVSLLQEVTPQIDRVAEPRLLLCARHNLLGLLTIAGRHDEAEALLPEVAALSHALDNDLDLVRLRWAEGRLAAGKGEAEQAITLLSSVRDELSSRGVGYDTALVSLELALVYARSGRFEEVRAIARDIIPLFLVQDVHREAIAALTVFVQAAEAGSADLALIAQVTDYLARAQGNPGLRFEIPGEAPHAS